MAINFTKEMIEIIDDEKNRRIQDALNKIEELNNKMRELNKTKEPLESEIKKINDDIDKIEREKSDVDNIEYPKEYLVFYNEERNQIKIRNVKMQNLDKINNELTSLQKEKNDKENELLEIQESLEEEVEKKKNEGKDFSELLDEYGDKLIQKHEENKDNDYNPDELSEAFEKQYEGKEFNEILAEPIDKLLPRKDAFKINEKSSAIAKTEKRAIEPAKEALQNQSRVTSDGKSVLIAKNPNGEETPDTTKTIDEIIGTINEQKENIQNTIENSEFDVDSFMNNNVTEDMNTYLNKLSNDSHTKSLN